MKKPSRILLQHSPPRLSKHSIIVLIVDFFFTAIFFIILIIMIVVNPPHFLVILVSECLFEHVLVNTRFADAMSECGKLGFVIPEKIKQFEKNVENQE